MLRRLNLIDRLYLFYLASIAGLAIWHGPGGMHLLAWHAAIAIAIILLAKGQFRSRIVAFVHDWYPLAMFIFSFEEIARFSLSLVPHWQDWRVVGLEQRLLGVSPNVWMGGWASRPVSELMDFGYFSYYPMFPLLGGLLYGNKRREWFRRLVLSSVMMYLLSFSIYLVFPCEGPRRALNGFVVPPPGYLFSRLVYLIQGGAGVQGNALPSSHVGLAVLCTVFAYRWKKKLGVTYVACTVLIGAGAVYDGYHYLSDVVAGLLVAFAAYLSTTHLFPETA